MQTEDQTFWETGSKIIREFFERVFFQDFGKSSKDKLLTAKRIWTHKILPAMIHRSQFLLKHKNPKLKQLGFEIFQTIMDMQNKLAEKNPRAHHSLQFFKVSWGNLDKRCVKTLFPLVIQFFPEEFLREGPLWIKPNPLKKCGPPGSLSHGLPPSSIPQAGISRAWPSNRPRDHGGSRAHSEQSSRKPPARPLPLL